MAEYVPIDLVRRYASEGMAESDIITRLKNQGFTNEQITQSMNAVLKASIAPRPMQVAGPAMMGAPQMPQQMAPDQRMLQPIQMPAPQMQRAPQQMQRMPQTERAPQGQPVRMGNPPERVSSPMTEFTFERPSERFERSEPEITLEEVIEGIVADRWHEFEDRLGVFDKRDMQLQQQIQTLSSKIVEIEGSTKKGEQELMGRFTSFDESMGGIEGRIGSMERVFKEFIPELSKNIKSMTEAMEKQEKK